MLILSLGLLLLRFIPVLPDRVSTLAKKNAMRNKEEAKPLLVFDKEVEEGTEISGY